MDTSRNMREKDRERERESRERNNENQWEVVRRKKKPGTKSHLASRTCFVNHLPIAITVPELAQIFRRHGAIEAITIPPN